MNNSNTRKATLAAGRLLLGTSTLALLTSGPAHAQQIINDGDDVTVTSGADSETISAAAGVASTVDGAPVVVIANNDVTLDNAGTLETTGITQTVQVNQGTTGTIINNAETGELLAESRVVNFDGSDATLNNDGLILGTASQRNGAVYGNRTSNNITVNNGLTGVIDAGVEGTGIAIEVGGGGAAIGGSITNDGVILGRGQAPAMGGTAGDGIRFFGPGLAPAYIYAGDITNSGLVESESNQGTVAAIRFADRIGFQGTLTNTELGIILGTRNGLYFGDADHAGGIVNNDGVITAESRALNINGSGLVINNNGLIVGIADQRNGTVYADSTSQDFVLNNLVDGIISPQDNEGAAFSIELAAEGNSFIINNDGLLQAGGTVDAGSALAGDAIRFERERVGGLLDGSTTGLFTGTINNSETGAIENIAGSGTIAGIRFVNGVSFQGEINNTGLIEGAANGVYFGNAVPAGGADHTGGLLNNLEIGTIRSASRALNIDGFGLTVNNAGSIVGTGDQRNGTVYADSTAQGFVLNNLETGVIDAGMGNQGAGFSVELSAEGNDFTTVNAGTIQGRGQAAAGAATAGDGLRFERERVGGMLDGTTTGLFSGTITNSGTIDSEAANGTAAGIRFVNGVSFQGELNNSGTISGVQNGLYFGNPTPAGGGDFSMAVVNNSGTISSGSRALNIDGFGLTVNNLAGGQIIGTGNQRNGTVYADGTADDFTVNNDGLIDAGMGNNGSGLGVEIGDAVDGANTFALTNTGTIQGRGQAGPMDNQAGDGVRIGNVGNTGVAEGTIVNSGTINSESMQGPVAGLRVVNGVNFTGSITNSGTISGGNHGIYLGAGDHTGSLITNSGTLSGGVNAFFAGNALSAVNVVNNGGTLVGNFVGSSGFEDSLAITGTGNSLQGNILNNVAVTTAAGSTTDISGTRTLDGSLTHNGTLSFDLDVDSLAVDGDTVLGMGSVINVAADQIGQADVGRTISVVTETGMFTNNGATVNVADDDFLIDYEPVFGSVAIAVNAVDLGNVSADANINSFGSAITSATANNRLATPVFDALNALASPSAFEAIALDLLPAINDGVTREIYETQRFASSQVQDRLRGEGTGLWGAAFVRNADADLTSLSSLGYDADAIGFTLGVDTRLGETATVGVLFNYSDIEVDANGTARATSEIDAFQIGGYAGFDLGQAYINAELGYSTSSVDSSRTALGAPITGESDVDGVYASLNAGYDVNAGGFAITPSVGLRYADLSHDTFTENGGLDLTLDTDSAEFLEARAGVRVAGTATAGLVPFASVDYAYDLSSDPIAVAGSFNGGVDRFVVVADEASQSRFDFAAGLDFINEGGLTVGAEYRGRFASEYSSHSGGIRVRFAF